MFSDNVRTIAIVGAGVAGLVTARRLLASGLECSVFERSDALGGVWSDGYAGFGVQVQRELFEFPEFPHDPDVPDFTPGELIQEYLERYAAKFDLKPRIRFGSAVTRVHRSDGARGWTVTCERDGRSERHSFDLVVVCTGLYSNRPHLPEYPAQETFAGDLFHVSEFRDRGRVAGKRVVVVGFGKSATDAALEASEVATSTSLVFREPHWPVPPVLLGVLPFKWAMLNRLTSTLLPPYYRAPAVARVLHGPGRPLVWLWWRIVERLLIAQYGLGSRGGRRPDLVPRRPVEYDALGESVMLPRPTLYPALRNGTIEPLQAEIARFRPAGVTLTDGTDRDADAVILATGWEADYGYLDTDVLTALNPEDDGLWLYRQIVPPGVDDLAFVGYAATISNMLTYDLQARWLAGHVTGACVLPDVARMKEDVASMRAWKRRALPPSRGRAARLLLHMQSYHDQLLEDAGISPLRKTGVFAPFKEAFAPYQPSDYRDLDAGRR